MKIKISVFKYNIGIIFIFLSLVFSVIAFAANFNINGNVNTSGYIMQKGNTLIPSGTITPFYLSSCPAGWILADGNNGRPDLRGVFVRGYGTPYGYISNVPSSTIGMKQEDTMQIIKGTFDGNTDDGPSNKTGAFYDTGTYASGSNGGEGGGVVGFDSSRVSRTSSETRPKNVALLYCVKQ